MTVARPWAPVVTLPLYVTFSLSVSSGVCVSVRDAGARGSSIRKPFFVPVTVKSPLIVTLPLNVAAVVQPCAKSAEPLPFVTASIALSSLAALTFAPLRISASTFVRSSW